MKISASSFVPWFFPTYSESNLNNIFHFYPRVVYTEIWNMLKLYVLSLVFVVYFSTRQPLLHTVLGYLLLWNGKDLKGSCCDLS